MTGAAVLALLFFVLPIAQARSVLYQMAGALEDVSMVRMQSYSVAEDGTLTKSGTVDYDRGKWLLQKASGLETQVYLGGKLYRFDPLTNAYVVEDRPEGPFAHNSKGLALSSFIDTYKGWGRKVDIGDGRLNGKRVVVAASEDTDLQQKLVLYADRGSMLPIKSESFSFEQGEWKLSGVSEFDYSPKFPTGHFAMKPGVPTVTIDEYDQRLVDAMTSKTLASIETKEGTFVLRSVDVAADGTVFVAYQIGDKSQTWRGFRLHVTDDLGNEYTSPTDSWLNSDPFLKKSKDGRLEREVFVPIDPAAPWKTRTIKVESRFTPDNEMVLFIAGHILDRRMDGTAWFNLRPNTEGVDPDHLPPLKEVWSGSFKAPTCDLRPDYMARLDYSDFNNEVVSRMYRSGVLARHFQNYEDWPSAKRWLEEDLRLKNEHARKGYGNWSLDDVQRQLEAVNARLKKNGK